MSDDIRLKISFKDHRKRKKANLLLGLQKSATDYILDLWISCAQNHPTGDLAGMDEVDIAFEAGWDGDPHVFVEAMVKAKVIDRNGEGVYKIHDWEEHQPWVAHKKERSEIARANAEKKWSSKNKQTRSERMTEARKKGNHTEVEWQEMKAFFGTCVKCEGSSGLVNCERDHVIPIYQGGSHGLDNIQPLCAKCNASKGPDNTDYRVEFCRKHNLKMPAKYVPNACQMHAPTSAPSPSPSPSLKDKEKDLASPGSLKLLVTQLDSKCKTINTLPKKKEKFNAHQWVQWCANHRYHPEAVAGVLDTLISHWQEIANPWTYATKVIQKESGNFYERDGTRNAQKEKEEWLDLINRLKAVHGG
jgi:5-methylcytosine-specific restriction endonuclease McrA